MVKSKNLRLLLIDDDELSLETLSSMLQLEGLRHEAFHDPIKALEAFRQDSEYSAVITDMKMPGMNGLEFVNAIRSIREEIPVILMTAFSEQEALFQESGIRVDGLYLKPIDIQALLSQLKEYAGSNGTDENGGD
jgi:CheY-like chemotaxis protein